MGRYRRCCGTFWGAGTGQRAELYEKGGGALSPPAVFSAPPDDPLRYAKTPEQLARQEQQKELADLVLDFLPERGTTQGMSLKELQWILQRHQHITAHQRRPGVLLEAVQHLQFAGLVSSSADQPGDDLTNRRYWRVRTFWDE